MKNKKPSQLKLAIFLSGISQLEVAKKLGVYRSRLTLWANGWEPVPEKYQSKLAEILGLPQTCLFCNTHEGVMHFIVIADELANFFKGYDRKRHFAALALRDALISKQEGNKNRIC